MKFDVSWNSKMTDKERNIINYLIYQKGLAYYIDIRNTVGLYFDDEEDFDNTLKLLTIKNWIYETDFGTTLYKLNEQMTKTENFEIELNDYLILTNGSDGGNFYLKTKIIHKGQERNLIVLFKDKNEIKNVKSKNKIRIVGDLMDEGTEYVLTLYNTIIRSYV